MRIFLIALLAAISYAQTDNQDVAGNADAKVEEVASCWPWWCFPATSNLGDGADSDGCKMWIAHALARGCSPYRGLPQQYVRPAMYPVGPVMGPGMPIQGPAPAADANQNAVQDGDAIGTNAEEQKTQEENTPGVSGFTEGLKLEKPAVKEPEKAASVPVEESATPVEETEIVEKETPAKKLRHTSPHTKKVLQAIHVQEQWTNAGMWFGLSFLMCVLGALAGYGITHYLHKRRAMSCLAGYGWDIPLTSRTDDL